MNYYIQLYDETLMIRITYSVENKYRKLAKHKKVKCKVWHKISSLRNWHS